MGWSAGHRRHRADYYLPNQRPKRLWLKELGSGARQSARGVVVAVGLRGGGEGGAARVAAAERGAAAQFDGGAVAGARSPGKQSALSDRVGADDRGDGVAGGGAPDQRDRPLCDAADAEATDGVVATLQERDETLLRSTELQRVLRGAHPYGSGGVCPTAERLAGTAVGELAGGVGAGWEDDPRDHRHGQLGGGRRRLAGGGGADGSEGRRRAMRTESGAATMGRGV